MQISEHFALKEFFRGGRVPSDVKTAYEMQGAHPLLHRTWCVANLLCEPARRVWGEPILVTSGVRTQQDHDRLVSRGYKPSETSDHLVNEVNGYATGAVDLVPMCDGYVDYDAVWDLASAMRLLAQGGHIRPGQLIREELTKDDGSVTRWIHVSLPVDSMFSYRMSPHVKATKHRQQFLTIIDYKAEVWA